VPSKMNGRGDRHRLQQSAGRREDVLRPLCTGREL
jgi:hypothetical protein